MGVALDRAVSSGWRPPVSLRGAIMGCGVSYFVVSLALDSAGRNGLDSLWLASVLMVPAFGLLITAAAGADLTGQRTMLQRRSMVKLGQWSFALYLLHRPVHEVVQGSAATWGLGQSIALGSLTVALLIAASAAVHEWFEKPIERRIRSWGGQRKPVARGAAIVLAPGALASAAAEGV